MRQADPLLKVRSRSDKVIVRSDKVMKVRLDQVMKGREGKGRLGQVKVRSGQIRSRSGQIRSNKVRKVLIRSDKVMVYK